MYLNTLLTPEEKRLIDDLRSRDRKVITNALVREINTRLGDGNPVPAQPAPPPFQFREDGTTAPYEDCIAAYLVGRLALDGYLPPDFLGDLEAITEQVSSGLLKGVRAYGWKGSLRELIHAGDYYRLQQRKGGAE